MSITCQNLVISLIKPNSLKFDMSPFRCVLLSAPCRQKFGLKTRAGVPLQENSGSIKELLLLLNRKHFETTEKIPQPEDFMLHVDSQFLYPNE